MLHITVSTNVITNVIFRIYCEHPVFVVWLARGGFYPFHPTPDWQPDTVRPVCWCQVIHHALFFRPKAHITVLHTQSLSVISLERERGCIGVTNYYRNTNTTSLYKNCRYCIQRLIHTIQKLLAILLYVRVGKINVDSESSFLFSLLSLQLLSFKKDCCFTFYPGLSFLVLL